MAAIEPKANREVTARVTEKGGNAVLFDVWVGVMMEREEFDVAVDSEG